MSCACPACIEEDRFCFDSYAFLPLDPTFGNREEWSDGGRHL